MLPSITLICKIIIGLTQGLGLLCYVDAKLSFADWAKKVLATNAVSSYLYCTKFECCNEKWIVNNIAGLKADLEKELYGQHLVQKAVLSHIQGHVQKHRSPDKALVLSFHGPTGTGKNFVTGLIAKRLYKQGLKSENVRFISTQAEFPHLHMVSDYKDRLQKIVENQVQKCPQSMFIFDEIDKMPNGVMDIVKPYLEYHHAIDGVDYRRAIFVFLSNSGEQAITKYVLKQYNEGKHRKDITLFEVEKILSKAAINTNGLWHSDLVSRHLVTAFLPFMPLERSHVRDCICDVMVKKGHYSIKSKIPEVLINEVMDELVFYPADTKLFSVTGCKRISEKVDFVVMN